MKPQKSHNASGLVFIEILVVLVIILVFSSFVILTYSTYRRNLEITSTAQQIHKTLRTARTMAISQNAYFLVTTDLDLHKIWIDESNPNKDIVQPKVETPVVLHEDIDVTEIRVNATTYTSGAVEILFEPDGSAEYAVFNILRKGENPAIDRNYYSVRVFTNGVSQVLPNRKL